MSAKAAITGAPDCYSGSVINCLFARVCFNDTATTEIYTLSLHDALPILVASLPLIKERILVIILLLHFLSLMLGSVLVLMLPLLVWLTPDLRIKKSLLKCNWTIRKRLPRCKMRLKKRLLA